MTAHTPDPIPPASGDLEALRGIIDSATDAALPPVCDTTGNGTQLRAQIQCDIANTILAHLRPAVVGEAVEAGLKDARTVHINMLRGGIAKLTPEQIGHLYRGDEAVRVAAEVKRQNPDVFTTPASHDALIARVRALAAEGADKAGCDGWRAQEKRRLIVALLADLDAGAGR